MLDSFSTVLAGRTHPLGFQVFTKISDKILAKSSPSFTWQAEKHIANSSVLTVLLKFKQTNQTRKKKKKKRERKAWFLMLKKHRASLIHHSYFYGIISSKIKGLIVFISVFLCSFVFCESMFVLFGQCVVMWFWAGWARGKRFLLWQRLRKLHGQTNTSVLFVWVTDCKTTLGLQ